jgi:peptide/nickel transport system permease protein
VKCGRKTVLLLIALAFVHVAVLLAGFFAPYDVAKQDRDLPYAPPTRLHFSDVDGQFHVVPFVCISETQRDTADDYVEDCKTVFPVHFLVRGSQYTVLHLFTSHLHLFGVDAPAEIFLMGTDSYGRDVFSRFIYGGQVSLFAGLLATFLSLTVGALLGLVAGFYGGSIDAIVMRAAELFLAVPWLYLLFAVRAFLPLSLQPGEAFLLLAIVIGAVGWARPAKMMRAIALGARERHYVLAARLFGGSSIYVIRRHILPESYSIIATQAALLIPQYILAEVVLSFLGLGIGEPIPSWGNMLSALNQYSVLVSYWWMLSPALMLVPLFLGYLLLASGLQVRMAERE